jgi:serine/threonine protein phosphatase PrpC
MQTDIFDFSFTAGSALDIGKKRQSNMDQVIFCPETGFFAVADGMGGLANGGKASDILAKVIPGIVKNIYREHKEKKFKEEQAAIKLQEQIAEISGKIYKESNSNGDISYGSTLSGVWLIGKTSVYINLGDSRGYLLQAKDNELRQITIDHNLATELVKAGELTKEQARNHPSSSRLIQFAGMPPPAYPDYFMEDISSGSTILICSDGLYGMLDDPILVKHLKGDAEPDELCQDLVNAANEAGGRDNISAVIIKIGKSV